jgi:hypothetical protein
MTTDKLFIQDGEEMREYTAAEYAQAAKDVADALAAKTLQEAAEAKEAAALATATAKLAALGLTVTDLKALGL